MTIQTISQSEYKTKKAICDKAAAILKKLAPDTYNKEGVVPTCVIDHPDYKACNNTIRGEVEQYELLHNPPEKLIAYIGTGNKNGMGCDRIIGQTYPITVWTGLPIGNATIGSSWRVNSYMGTHMHQFYARIAGREYTGRSFGEGMCIILKETAASKKSRSN